MANNCNYNCTELTDHERQACGDYRMGGINAVAIIDCDHTITDWSSASEWQTNIDAGKIKIIAPVVASVPDATPVEGTNPNGCGAATILDTFDRTVAIRDYNVNAPNVTFYNGLNDRSAFVALFHGCNTEEITVIEKPVSFTSFLSVPENNREKQFWNVTGKWTARDQAPIYDAPVGIFNI